MADTVAVTILNDGIRNAVVHCTNQSDGTGESDVVKVDPADFSPVPSEFAIDRIEYSTRGMGVDILFEATADRLAVSLPPDHQGTIDYRMIGGLKNTAGAGKNGKIGFTTIGHSAGDGYSITLFLKKQ